MLEFLRCYARDCGSVSNENQHPPVPLVELGRQNAEFEEELLSEVRRILQSSQFILGREVEAFEQRFAAEVGAFHAVGMSSGTDALVASLMALDIGPGDEVLCPAFTFFATAGSIARVGATPVFVDVCPACFNLDTDDLKSKVTDKTKAILPVHLFGQAAEMDTIMEIAREHELLVIEDCAQALGAKYRGTDVGTMGTVGCYSFFPTKNLSGFGDAGMVTTNDDQLAETLRRVRNHGMFPKYEHVRMGGNFRIDAIQAAMLGVKLPHLPRWIAARAEHAAYYTASLSSMAGVQTSLESDCCCLTEQESRLGSKTEIILPVAYEHNVPTWNQYTIRVVRKGARNRLVEVLRASGVGCEIYYPKSLDQQPCFENSRPERSLRVSNLLAGQCLSLPVFPELKPVERERVVAVIGEWLARQ